MLKCGLIFALLSDQCNDWSDKYSKRNSRCTFETTKHACAPAATAALDPAWLPHRAIQAVRKTGLQMRRGSRTWPQVLPVGQLSRSAPANGLRTTGEYGSGKGVSGQLSASAGDSRADLRDQPRIAAPPRGPLTRCYERIADTQLSTDRCRAGGCTLGQYAGELAGRRSRAIAFDGDPR
jgi:hypothetical protein